MAITTSLSALERRLKTIQAEKIIDFYLRRWGQEVRVIRDKILQKHISENGIDDVEQVIDAAISVYGTSSGLTPAEAVPVDINESDSNVAFTAKVFMVKTIVSPLDAAMSGEFEREMLYTKKTQVRPNDIIEYTDESGTDKRQILTTPEQVGRTQSVFKRWRMDNIGGIGVE